MIHSLFCVNSILQNSSGHAPRLRMAMCEKSGYPLLLSEPCPLVVSETDETVQSEYGLVDFPVAESASY